MLCTMYGCFIIQNNNYENKIFEIKNVIVFLKIFHTIMYLHKNSYAIIPRILIW